MIQMGRVGQKTGEQIAKESKKIAREAKSIAKKTKKTFKKENSKKETSWAHSLFLSDEIIVKKKNLKKK